MSGKKNELPGWAHILKNLTKEIKRGGGGEEVDV